jgi:hypothetical protein
MPVGLMSSMTNCPPGNWQREEEDVRLKATEAEREADKVLRISGVWGYQSRLRNRQAKYRSAWPCFNFANVVDDELPTRAKLERSKAEEWFEPTLLVF